MAVQFTFVGQIKPIKDSDRLKGFDTQTFASNWQTQTVKFNAIADGSRFILQSKAGYWSKNGTLDESRTTIYTLQADANGGKPKNIQVKYGDRFNTDIVANVPQYRLFVLDTEVYGYRTTLKKFVDAMSDGSATDEDKVKFGANTVEEAQVLLDKSNKKRHEYISEIDFVTALNKLLKNPEVSNKKWYMRGTIDYTYSEAKDTWYRELNVQKIYQAPAEAEVGMTANHTVYFTTDALEEGDDRAVLTCYGRTYLSQYKNDKCKGQVAVPLSFVIKKDDEKKYNLLKKRFTVEDGEFKEMGIVVKMIDGAESKPITYEDLDEDTRDSIDAKLVSLEDVQRELGGSVFGERVTYTQVIGVQRGYASGAKDTLYTAEDFGKPKHDEVEEEIDLFADDLDI